MVCVFSVANLQFSPTSIDYNYYGTKEGSSATFMTFVNMLALITLKHSGNCMQNQGCIF